MVIAGILLAFSVGCTCMGERGALVFLESVGAAGDVGQAVKGCGGWRWTHMVWALESFSSCPEPAALSQWDINVEGSSEGLPSPSPGQPLQPCPSWQTHLGIPALGRQHLPVPCSRWVMAWPAAGDDGLACSFSWGLLHFQIFHRLP